MDFYSLAPTCPIPYSFRSAAESSQWHGDTLILIPGLGCSRQWFNSAFTDVNLRHVTLVSFDHPNQGDFGSHNLPRALWPLALAESWRSVQTIYELVASSGTRFHIAAHSMGAIPGLAAWRSIPARNRGVFFSIEGNMTGTDCFASSRMAESVDAVNEVVTELAASTVPSLRRWSRELESCDPLYIQQMSSQVTAVCATDELTARWEYLEHPHYLFGEHTGYPEHHRDLFERTHTVMHEIPGAGHFPMADNPNETWKVIAQAIRSAHA